MNLKNSFNRLTIVGLTCFFSITLVSCGEDMTQNQIADGLSDFKYAVDVSYQRLVNGQIKRNKGFDSECAVHWDTHGGIRISETVCGKENSGQEITVRITDPTSRPPSQRVDKFLIDAGNGSNISVSRGEIQALENGISIEFDRSGQSIIIIGKSGI